MLETVKTLALVAVGAGCIWVAVGVSKASGVIEQRSGPGEAITYSRLAIAMAFIGWALVFLS